MYELKSDKTYFFTNNGVKVLKSIILNDKNKITLHVYDRMDRDKSQVLNINDINYILTKDSEEYYRIIKEFLIFLGKDLAPKNKLIYDLLIALWNHDDEKATALIDEYTGLEEEMQEYLETLFNTKYSVAAKLFEEILYYQEFVYYKCLSKDELKFIV